MATMPTKPAKQILLINSAPHVREVMQACLSHLGGWQVLEASSAARGLQLAVENPPDAIVLDLLTSRMDYVTFLENLRRQPPTQAVPVVVLTAGAKWLDFKRFESFQVAGAIEYLADPAEIPKQIAKLLDWGYPAAEADENYDF